MTCRIHFMLIELVVAQELLTRRVRGSFCLHDSNAWLEPRHNCRVRRAEQFALDRKSTRLNSSHGYISYAVFCLKKKNTTAIQAFLQHVHCQTVSAVTT